MVKIIRFAVFAILLSCTSVLAQSTYYYKHLKTIKDGVTSTSVSGGQFITFNENVCYESDRNGSQVNNSRLNYLSTENGIKVYYGTCYWGKGVTFLLTADNNRMNVKTLDGNVYVYERTTAPSNALTCSLIREKQSDGTYIPQPVNPVGGVIIDGTKDKENPKKQQPKIRTKCPNCTNGRRVYEKTNGSVPGGLGSRNMKRCSECGITYNANNITHFHDRCTTCHGKGYLD